EMTLGIIPGFAGTQRLPHYVGSAKAYEMILTGEPITGQEAYTLGLANQVVNEQNVVQAAMTLAEKIAAKSRPGINQVMRLIPYAKTEQFSQGVQREAEAFSNIFGLEDAKEGIEAFIEKRTPHFKDKQHEGGLSMNIYVLLKRTFDTEEKITVSDGQIEDDGAEFIINPYDEYAVEEAIKQRDEHGGEVTVVTVGDEDSEKQLRTALAMGADKAVLINTEDDLDDGDQYTTTKMLEAFFADKEYDLILAGNVAIDEASGQVGPRLAECLGISCITTITSLEIDGDTARIDKDVEGDVEKIETQLPALFTCQQGLNEPRYPSLPGIMKAKKKPLEELEIDDLDLDEDDVEAKTKTIDVFLPPE